MTVAGSHIRGPLVDFIVDEAGPGPVALAMASSAITAALAGGGSRLGGIDSLEDMSGTVTGRSVGRNLFAGFGEVSFFPSEELAFEAEGPRLYERLVANAQEELAPRAFEAAVSRAGLTTIRPGVSLGSRHGLLRDAARRVYPIACDWNFPGLSGGPLRPGRENPVARSQAVHAQLLSAVQYASEEEGWSMRADAARLRKQKIAPSDRELGQLSVGLSRILEESGAGHSFEISAKFYGYGALRRLIATLSVRGPRTGRGGSIGLLVGRGTPALAASTEEEVDAQLLEEHRRSRFARAATEERARRFGRRGRA